MQETTGIQKSIPLPDGPDDIGKFIEEVFTTLAAYVHLDTDQRRRVKLILIELATNSIKHTTDEQPIMRLTINDPKLTFEKIDVGLEIQFEGAEQIPFKEIDKTISVSMPNRHNYAIKILSPYRFKFIDSFNEQDDIQNIPEHFGFYIITMASDNFEYHYNPDLKQNIFQVNINLKKKI